jgi:hypothetical protein
MFSTPCERRPRKVGTGFRITSYTTTQARESVTGHGVRYVLLISTAAVIVVFAAIWLYYFH